MYAARKYNEGGKSADRKRKETIEVPEKQDWFFKARHREEQVMLTFERR